MRAPLSMTASALAVFLVACSAPVAQEFDKADTDHINKLIQEFVTIYNAKEAPKLAALFTGGGVVMPPNASTVRGTENVREYYAYRFSRGASDLVLEPQNVAGHGPLAYASGDYRLTMAPPDGPSRRDRGKFIFILRDTNDRWLLDHLMFSSDFAEDPSAR